MQVITANVKVEKRGLSRTSLVSLYSSPPTEELTLDEFELLAVDRLQLLRSIEQLKARGFEEEDLNRRIADVSY
jgi:DNA primase large subunit